MAEEQAGTNGHSEGPMAQFRALASDLVARVILGQATAGLTYKGDRDVSAQLGYIEKLQPSDYRARYERGGIAERIVESTPKETWRGGITLVEDPDPKKDTEFEVAWKEMATRLRIWPRMQRADILAGLGQYAIIVIGAPGKMETELTTAKPEDIKYLACYAQQYADISEYDTDTESERWGKPTEYKLLPRTNDKRFKNTAAEVKVHWTRVIHVAEGLLDDELFGKPRLRAAWNLLDDLAKVVGGGAEAAWKRMDPGMQLDLDKDIELAEGEEDKLADEVEEYRHGLSRFIRTRGVSMNMLTTAVAAFGPNAMIILDLIAATVGIPKRILMGSERGELASGQDRTNWNTRIRDRRAEFAEPVVRDFVDRMIMLGALPTPQQYEVKWPDMDDLTEEEKAGVVAKLAEANQKLVGAGLPPLMTTDEIRDMVYRLAPLDQVMDGNLSSLVRGVVARALSQRLRAAAFDTDRPDDELEPEWKQIHNAADAHVGSIVRTATRMLEAAREEVDEDKLRIALEVGDERAAASMVAIAVATVGADFDEEMAEVLFDTLVAGGDGAAAAANERGSYLVEGDDVTESGA